MMVRHVVGGNFPCLGIIGSNVPLPHLWQSRVQLLKMEMHPEDTRFQNAGHKILNLQGSHTSALAPHDICFEEVSKFAIEDLPITML